MLGIDFCLFPSLSLPLSHTHMHWDAHTEKGNCRIFPAWFPSWESGSRIGDFSTGMRIPQNIFFLGWSSCISFKTWWGSSQQWAAFARAETVSYLIKAQTSIFVWEYFGSPSRRCQLSEGCVSDAVTPWRHSHRLTTSGSCCHAPSDSRPPSEAAETPGSSHSNFANSGKQNRIPSHESNLSCGPTASSMFGKMPNYPRRGLPLLRSHLTTAPNQRGLRRLAWGKSFLLPGTLFLVQWKKVLRPDGSEGRLGGSGG